MKYISKIKIPDFAPKYSCDLTRELSNLSKINILIGKNNSGKSRFMRILLSHQKEIQVSWIEHEKIETCLEKFYSNMKELFRANNVTKYGDVVTVLTNSKIPKYFSQNFDFDKEIFAPINKIKNAHKSSLSVNREVQFHIAKIKGYTDQYTYEVLSDLNRLISDKEKIEFNQIYIPTLRGLRPLSNQDKDKTKSNSYSIRTKRDYFNEDENDNLDQDTIALEEGIEIFTGLELYNSLKNSLLGEFEEREKVAKFEQFLSETFFQNKRITLIPNINDDVVYIKIGDEKDLPIYNLGDGIQAIILITYPLFRDIDKPTIFYIEEPELFLHPGLQRVLMECFLNDLFINHQFFITSHSNHLLDMTLDYSNISVFSFKKQEKSFLIENMDNPNIELLQQLGVKNSSVFLSNCTIWVEGITDRIYLRKYLSLYQENLAKQNSDTPNQTILEDTHYSFVEFGGNNITHWSFLEPSDPDYPNIDVKKLCGKLFLISDNDGAGLKVDGTEKRTKSAKYERHLKLIENLGDNYYCLKCREIENLLSPTVLKQIIWHYEKKDSSSLKIQPLSYSNYKNVLLGRFIEQNVNGISRKYAAKSGTIKEKVKFAKFAVQSMTSLDDLTPEARDLTKKVYNFITEQNKANM